MSDLSITALWFQRAIPNPTERNVQVQLGCHFEEVNEMLQALGPTTDATAVLLSDAAKAVHALAEALKKGDACVQVLDRKELLDACCDQQVTATGVGHMLGLDVVEGLSRVNSSNFSKFGMDGQPIFDVNGKIAKAPTYFKPNFEGLY